MADQALSTWDTVGDALQAAGERFGLQPVAMFKINPPDVERFALLDNHVHSGREDVVSPFHVFTTPPPSLKRLEQACNALKRRGQRNTANLSGSRPATGSAWVNLRVQLTFSIDPDDLSPDPPDGSDGYAAGG